MAGTSQNFKIDSSAILDRSCITYFTMKCASTDIQFGTASEKQNFLRCHAAVSAEYDSVQSADFMQKETSEAHNRVVPSC